MSHAGVLQVTLATPIYSTANSCTSDSLVDLSGVLLLLSVAQLLLPQLPMTGTERCCCYWRSGYAGCCCLSTRLAPMLLTTKCCSSPVACRNAVYLLHSCIQHTPASRWSAQGRLPVGFVATCTASVAYAELVAAETARIASTGKAYACLAAVYVSCSAQCCAGCSTLTTT